MNHLKWKDFVMFFSEPIGTCFEGLETLFSTSHVIPHIRALVPCPGLTYEVCVVASTSVSLTPTEILFFCRVPDRNRVFL